MISDYPKAEIKVSKKIYKDIEWLKDFISSVRNIRGELKIKPSLNVNCYLQHGTKQDKMLIEELGYIIQGLANLNELTWISNKDSPPPSSVAVIRKMKILIPLKGLINPSEEIERLNKSLSKLNKEGEMLQEKLDNKKFIFNAPKELVKNQILRSKEIKNEINQLNSKLIDLKALI